MGHCVDWAGNRVNMPKPEDSIIYRKRRKGQGLEGSTIDKSGNVVPADPGKLERGREYSRRRRETEKFNRETGRICINCGKVLSGPHANEIGGPEAGARQEYKGHSYSSALCENCAQTTPRDFRAEYMEYRRQHPKEDT